MPELDQTPRVHAEYLSHYIGRRVRVVGQVKEVAGQAIQLDSHGSVMVQLNFQLQFVPEKDSWIEVISEVQPDLSLRGLAVIPLGTSLDAKLVYSAVENWQKYRSLFIKAEPAST